jgi:hypothetical protein
MLYGKLREFRALLTFPSLTEASVTKMESRWLLTLIII